MYLELEVPLNRSDNTCMMDDELRMWVKEKMSEVYWEFRDDVDDEGGKRLEEELDYVEMKIVEIIRKHSTVE